MQDGRKPARRPQQAPGPSIWKTLLIALLVAWSMLLAYRFLGGSGAS